MQIIILAAGTEAAGGGNFGKSWGWWTATAGERAMGKSTSHCGTFRISIALRELIDAHKSVELAPGRAGNSRRAEKREMRNKVGKSGGGQCNSLCMRNHCSRKLENFRLCPRQKSQPRFGYIGTYLVLFLH